MVCGKIGWYTVRTWQIHSTNFCILIFLWSSIQNVGIIPVQVLVLYLVLTYTKYELLPITGKATGKPPGTRNLSFVLSKTRNVDAPFLRRLRYRGYVAPLISSRTSSSTSSFTSSRRSGNVKFLGRNPCRVLRKIWHYDRFPLLLDFDSSTTTSTRQRRLRRLHSPHHPPPTTVRCTLYKYQVESSARECYCSWYKYNYQVESRREQQSIQNCTVRYSPVSWRNCRWYLVQYLYKCCELWAVGCCHHSTCTYRILVQYYLQLFQHNAHHILVF